MDKIYWMGFYEEKDVVEFQNAIKMANKCYIGAMDFVYSVFSCDGFTSNKIILYSYNNDIGWTKDEILQEINLVLDDIQNDTVDHLVDNGLETKYIQIFLPDPHEKENVQNKPLEGINDGGEGKGRFDLITPFGLERLARWYELGAQKYSDRNWEKGIPFSRYMDSTMRHLNKYMMGMTDEDHLAAAAWNILAIIHHEQLGQIELDDLPHYLKNMEDYKKSNSTFNACPTDESLQLFLKNQKEWSEKMKEESKKIAAEIREDLNKEIRKLQEEFNKMNVDMFEIPKPKLKEGDKDEKK